MNDRREEGRWSMTGAWFAALGTAALVAAILVVDWRGGGGVAVLSSPGGMGREGRVGLFPGRSLFAGETWRGMRRAHSRGFFEADRQIFPRFEGLRRGRIHRQSLAAAGEETASQTTKPSSFLKSIVQEVEQVRHLPKEASMQLHQSEESVKFAQQQLRQASKLRLQAADDEERADALDPSVAPLEEAALQEDVRAQYFNKRADKALKEAAKEQNDLKKMQVKENAGPETSFKQKLLMRVVNKVVHKVDDGK